MGFMSIYTQFGLWYEVTATNGEGTLVSSECVGLHPEAGDFADYIEGKPASFERHEGWAARYSANGYMDRTEWCGVYATEEEAIAQCKETFGDDEEDDDACPETQPEGPGRSN